MDRVVNADEMLKKLASEAAAQGDAVRETVRALALKALQNRELSLTQIKSVLKTVTEGVSLGVAEENFDAEKVFADALAGMDDALLKAVQASQLALERLTSQGRDFQESYVKKAIDDLERLEDEWLKTVKEASSNANERVKEQWSNVLKHTGRGDTETGAQVKAAVDQFQKQMRATGRESRALSLKATELLSENFATLASGVLIGLSEAYQQKDGVMLAASSSARAAPRRSRKAP